MGQELNAHGLKELIKVRTRTSPGAPRGNGAPTPTWNCKRMCVGSSHCMCGYLSEGPQDTRHR